jgi:hypothetical protein
MSFRSAVETPTKSTGDIGSITTGASVDPGGSGVLNDQNTPQYFGSVFLPAGTYVITSSVQVATTAPTGNQYFGISLNQSTTILNYFADQLATGVDDRVWTWSNVVTLTADSTEVSLFCQTDSAPSTQYYYTWTNSPLNAPIIALKIA